LPAILSLSALLLNVRYRELRPEKKISTPMSLSKYVRLIKAWACMQRSEFIDHCHCHSYKKLGQLLPRASLTINEYRDDAPIAQVLRRWEHQL